MAERKVTCSFGAAGSSATGSRLRRFSTKRTRIPSPISAIEKETRKTVLYWPGSWASRTKAASGPSIAPTVSSARCTPKERPEAGALAVERDQRVARGGADALAQAVDEQDGRRPQPRAAHRDEAELAQRRRAVARGGDLLVALLAVGQQAAEQAHERGGALVHAVDEAELQRAEADLVGQVQRQDRRDHLLREVGEEADEAEQDDGPGDRDPASAGARRGGRDDLGRHVAHGGVHARITRPRTADLHGWTGRIESDTASYPVHRRARDVLPPVQPPPGRRRSRPRRSGTPQGQYASGPPSAARSAVAPQRAEGRRQRVVERGEGGQQVGVDVGRARLGLDHVVDAARARAARSMPVDQPEGVHRQQRGAEGRPLVAGGEADRACPARRPASGATGALRAKPPVARISRTSLPASRIDASTSASCRQTPSSAARTRWPRPWWRVEPDVGAARPPSSSAARARRAGRASISSPSLPGGDLRGQLEQGGLGVRAEVGRQRLARPAQHDAAVVDRAADDPAPRHQRVAEDAAAGDRPRALDHQPQRAAGADRAGRHAGVHGAHAEVGQRPVGGADDERQPRPRARARPRPPPRARAAAWSGTSGDSVAGVDARDRRAPRGPSRARAGSSRPVPEATEWSTAHVPVSRATTSSLIPAQRRDGGERLGLVLGEPQRAWAAATSDAAACPVRSCSSGCSARRRSACSVARMSPHVMSGVSARPSRVEARRASAWRR